MVLASIVITTRNRRDDLMCAVASCLAQEMAAQDATLEVLVIDDASDDGSADAVRQAFPDVRVITFTKRRGLVANRSSGFEEAQGKYVISLDDDAYFSQPDIVSKSIMVLEADDGIGAVAIPLIEPKNRRSQSSLARPFHAAAGASLASYLGGSHVLRRELALDLGGYRDFFVHQHEERDLCLRMREAGYLIVYGPAGFVVHMVSPSRESKRILYYAGRNQILFEALNAPFPDLLLRLVRVPVGLIRYRFSFASLPVKLRGIAAGYAESLRRRHERRPVRREIYRSKLPNHGPEAWDAPVPPPCHELPRAPAPAITKRS